MNDSSIIALRFWYHSMGFNKCYILAYVYCVYELSISLKKEVFEVCSKTSFLTILKITCQQSNFIDSIIQRGAF